MVVDVSEFVPDPGPTATVTPDDRDGRLPQSFRLVCACCRWPPSTARDEAVRALSSGVGWIAFLRVAARQRVLGLAQAALTSAGVTPPQQVREELARAAHSARLRALALAAESGRLQSRFAEAGLRSLVIKGAPLAQMAYGSPALKQGRDVDLIVAPRDAEAGLALLQADGYQIAPPLQDLTPAQLALVFRHHKDLELHHPQRRLSVELHWRLIDNPRLLANVGAGSPSRFVDVSGAAPIETLADPDLFAYLCVHGASHAWFRLKWLADLNAWLSGKSGDELTRLHAHAVALGVGPCADQALWLCRRLLGLPLPPELAAKLRGLRVRLMTDAAIDAMAGGGAELELQQRPLGPFRLMPTQFLRSRSLAFLWAQLGLVVVNLEDRLALPLPRPLHFLYPFLRLPLWLARVARRQVRRQAGAPAVSTAGQGPR
jgi:hypothetical protein